MKKFKVLLAILSACSLFAFSGCKPTDNKENVINYPQYDIYKLAQGTGYEGTYEEWLKSIAGDAIVLKVENFLSCYVVRCGRFFYQHRKKRKKYFCVFCVFCLTLK
jgi:hypothetical protein